MISKISRKLLGYLPSKTNEKSIAFSSNSSGAYKNNKALSIARAVLGTSHVHIEYCVVMQRSVGYWVLQFTNSTLAFVRYVFDADLMTLIAQLI